MRKLLCILLIWAGALNVALAVGYSYDQQKGTISVYWDYDDMSGVLTEHNTEIIHWVTDGGKNNATFSAYGWSLVPNSNYYAYYPYSQSYIITKQPLTALPISYKAQSQKGNDNTDHLAKYDFMTAQTTSSGDACHFPFSHLGCVVRLECTVPEKAALRSVALTSQKEDFITEATMNVQNGTMSSVKRDEVMTLELKDIAVGEGENLVAYMMLPPTDLTDSHLKVVLTDSKGRTSEIDVQGTKILPGHVYPVTLQMPPFVAADNGYAAKAKKGATLMLAGDDNTIRRTTDQTIDHSTASAPDFTPDDANYIRKAIYILGDINNDGEVKMSDASMLVNRCLDGTAERLHRKVADVDGDGKIDIEDSKAIMDIFLNK